MDTVDVEIDRLLSTDEITARLGVSKVTLYGMIKANEFPAPLRVANKLKWRAFDLNAYLKGLRDREQGGGKPKRRARSA